MNKKEFKAHIEHIFHNEDSECRRLFKCKCWTYSYDNFPNLVIIKSYDTVVACIDKKEKACYIFGWYSNTTVHHIFTACKVLQIEHKVKLYNNSLVSRKQARYNIEHNFSNMFTMPLSLLERS